MAPADWTKEDSDDSQKTKPLKAYFLLSFIFFVGLSFIGLQVKQYYDDNYAPAEDIVDQQTEVQQRESAFRAILKVAIIGFLTMLVMYGFIDMAKKNQNIERKIFNR